LGYSDYRLASSRATAKAKRMSQPSETASMSEESLNSKLSARPHTAENIHHAADDQRQRCSEAYLAGLNGGSMPALPRRPRTSPQCVIKKGPKTQVPCWQSEVPDHKKSEEFGFMRKGEAARGKKKMESLLMLLKGRGIAGPKMKSLRFGLIKAQLSRYRVALNRAFIMKAKTAFLKVVEKKRVEQCDMNQFDEVMRRLGFRDVYVNDRIFKCFDQDNNGWVDLREFILGLTASWEGSLADKVMTYFGAVDVDGDGVLTHDEVSKMLLESEKWSGPGEVKPLVDRIFECLDPNRSGGISMEEFEEGFVKNSHILTPIFDTAFSTNMKIQKAISKRAGDRVDQTGDDPQATWLEYQKASGDANGQEASRFLSEADHREGLEGAVWGHGGLGNCNKTNFGLRRGSSRQL